MGGEIAILYFNVPRRAQCEQSAGRKQGERKKKKSSGMSREKPERLGRGETISWLQKIRLDLVMRLLTRKKRGRTTRATVNLLLSCNLLSGPKTGKIKNSAGGMEVVSPPRLFL